MKQIVIFLLLIIIFSCEEEVVNKPVFKTLQVKQLSEGASFEATVSTLGRSSFDNYGFVWASHSHPTFADSVYAFDHKPKEGGYRVQIKNDLVPGVVYHVTAFIKSGNKVLYSNTVQFESHGSASPVITDFNPKHGASGGTVVITGNNFSNIAGNVQVLVGTNNCQIIQASRNELKIKLPDHYISGAFPITVNTGGKTALSTTLFTLEGPVIQSVTPSSGPAGTIISINGTGFSATASENLIFIGSQQVLTTSASATLLKVPAPADNLAGPRDVSVEVKLAKSILPSAFNLTGPVITSFSPASGIQGSHVIITGSGFSATPEQNILRMGAYGYAEVIGATPEMLTVVVPVVPEAGNVSIFVTVKLIGASSSSLFMIEGPQVTGITPDAQYGGRTITLSGKNFDPNNTHVSFLGLAASVISGSSTSLTVQVPDNLQQDCPIRVQVGGIPFTTPFNFQLLSPWTKYPDFPGEKRYGATGFSIGSYGYVAMGIAQGGGDRKDVWRYDPSNGSWNKLSNFPGQSRAFAFSFVVNGKAYVGGGGHYGYSEDDLINSLFDLWEYDPSTDSWTQKQSFSPNGVPSRARLSATAIGSYGYFCSDQFLYRYDPSLDQWWVFNSVVGAYSPGSIAVTVGNKGYFGLGNNNSKIMEFDPAADTWKSIAGIDFGTGISFSINNKIYLGGASRFYEFDPATGFWRSLPPMPEIFGSTAYFTINNLGYVATGLNGTPYGIFYRFNPNY